MISPRRFSPKERPRAKKSLQWQFGRACCGLSIARFSGLDSGDGINPWRQIRFGSLLLLSPLSHFLETRSPDSSMASGMGMRGTVGRCFYFFQDLQKCAVRGTPCYAVSPGLTKEHDLSRFSSFVVFIILVTTLVGTAGKAIVAGFVRGRTLGRKKEMWCLPGRLHGMPSRRREVRTNQSP